MPFTPFHFGPHACVGLPLNRYLDVPVFLAANVVVDIEPLLVLTYRFDYPVHGYCHTLLIGGLLGLLLAVVAYPLRHGIGKAMSLFRLRYSPSFSKMAVAGVLGVWLHVLFDTPLYRDIKPFFPLAANPLYGIVTPVAVYLVCAICFLPALAVYSWLAMRYESS
jgi:hypothetical protein